MLECLLITECGLLELTGPGYKVPLDLVLSIFS